MNANAVLSLAPKLAQAILDDDWRAAMILAADLKAACQEEQTFKRWSPHSTGNAS